MATRNRIKRESTEYCGLPTPPEDTPTLSTLPPPKMEENQSDTSQGSNAQGGSRDDRSVSPIILEEAKSDQQVTLVPHHDAPRKPNQQPITSDPLSSPATTTAGTPPPAGLYAVGSETKAVVDVIDRVRLLVSGELSAEIPQVVLVGDQSSGKSSLLSAIAGINLPRGGSTCTRCPTNIKTAAAETWSCEVSLVKTFSFDSSKRLKKQSYPGWTPCDMIVEPFVAINNESELEEVLKWAQISLLNPSSNPAIFHPHSSRWTEQAQLRSQTEVYKEETIYSPNVISISISAPGLPTLSFYDLPGLIALSDDGDTLKDAFQELTKQYVRHEQSLIICALAMNCDPQTSTARALVRHLEAEDRCIGVITMPDRVATTDDCAYTRVLQGRDFKLRHGYFITKQPSANTRYPPGPQYHTYARRDELVFFDSSPHWNNNGVWAPFRTQCGTGVIQNYLSKKFVELVLARVPDIEKKVLAVEQQIDAELSTLPQEVISNAQSEVRNHLMDLSLAIRSLFDGTSKNFLSEWNVLCSQFQSALYAMMPVCDCHHESDKRLVSINDLDGSSEETFIYETPRKRPNTTPGTSARGAKFRRLNDSPIPYKQEQNVRSPNCAPIHEVQADAWKTADENKFGPFYQPYIGAGKCLMSISTLRQEINKETRAGVPDGSTEKVKEDYALLSVARWDEPLETLITETFKLLRNTIGEQLNHVLRQYSGTELEKLCTRYINEFLVKHEQFLREETERLCQVEKSALFTINGVAFKDYYGKALKAIKAERSNARTEAFIQKNPPPNPRRYEEDSEEYHALKGKYRKELKIENFPLDLFVNEIQVAAYIRGYYNVSRHRFSDSVAARINAHLRHEMARSMKYLLEEKLDLDNNGTVARCQELLDGDISRIRRRNKLKEKKQRLHEALDLLNTLRSGSQPDVDSDITMEDGCGASVGHFN